MYNQRKTQSIYHKRDGITLLFVISMVVLFLLMGTTFVVVSNDYYKAARRRSRLSTNVINNEALLDRAFYQLMREVPLADSSSPLRGHSILADQYGYGIKSQVAMVPVPAVGPFVNITLSANAINPLIFRRIRVPNLGVSLRTEPEYFDGLFNGQVFSVTSGTLRGVSTRIINSELFQGAAANGSLDQLTITIAKGNYNWSQLAAADEVLINGKDFGGTGAGDATALNLGNSSNDDVVATEILGINSLAVNQQGFPFLSAATGERNSTYINTTTDGAGAPTTLTGFLAIDNGPNESYDIPDFQNMFLSDLGNGIPSFHRDNLYTNRVTATASPLVLRQYTFRPIYVQDPTADDETALHSTANREFFDEYLADSFNDDGTSTGTANDVDHLDVDSDGDGTLDSVWIDIGLPTQVNSEGVRFRPLVAYRVIDMDGRLNVNAHGSTIDALISTFDNSRLGGSYDVADISLSGVMTSPADYTDLIGSRSAERDLTDNDDKRFGPDQMLFDWARGSNVNGASSTIFGSFATGSNLAGQFTFGSDASEIDAMPRLIAKTGYENLAAGTDDIPYDKDFRLGGGTGSSFYEPWELEALLRPFDNDAKLMSSRLLPLIANANAVTTDSFEVNVPAVSISPARRLNAILIANGVSSADIAARSTLVNSLLPRDLRLGGKLNINRPLGDGDNDAIGGGGGGGKNDSPAVDDSSELSNVDQKSGQAGNPTMNLDNAANGSGNSDGRTGDDLARYLLAKDIYITFLIACGDRAPSGFGATLTAGDYSEDFSTFAGRGGESAMTTADYEYRKMVAQFAVNVVDFKDANSIMTGFEFDIEPFDATGWDVDGVLSATADTDGFVVWGAERPELLLTETFAFHDRQTRDTDRDASGQLVADGDIDWDTVNAPISSAAFEIYNPWYSVDNAGNLANDMYGVPPELASGNGVDLGARVTSGGPASPVWRIALKRERSEKNVPANIVRSIYFSDPSAVPASAGSGDNFYPGGGAGIIQPGAYVSFMPATDPTLDGQVFTASTTKVNSSPVVAPRVVRVNLPRSLSISDGDGGYIDPATGNAILPGDMFQMPIDTPPGVDDEDLDAINTAGIVDNFRYAYLQRLANPSETFDVNDNPYLTIDTMTVDLVAGNSLGTGFGDPGAEVYNKDNAGASEPVVDNNYELQSTERGELFASAEFNTSVDLARKNLFASEDGENENDASDVATAVAFTHTFGALNTSYTGSTVPFGCLTWNNRPFASAGEIANVPYLPSGLITYFFNEGARPYTAVSDDMNVYHQHMMPFFGEVLSDPTVDLDGHRHLLRFGIPLGITVSVDGAVTGRPAPNNIFLPQGNPTLTANRFARLFDYIETPSLYLGNETFITTPGATTGGTYPINFFPPFHNIPEFRQPGKVNLNTISDTAVWTAINKGFSGLSYDGGAVSLRGILEMQTGPTDFSGFFSSAEGRSLVPGGDSDMIPAKGSSGTPFVRELNLAAPFDGVDDATHDIAGTAYFRNEFRQRLTSLTTTRSSVFSIWITIGYFEIDDQGRIGLEIGNETGETKRDRAFFMVDRSIPVAFEPGRNHNIEKTILTRTIID